MRNEPRAPQHRRQSITRQLRNNNIRTSKHRYKQSSDSRYAYRFPTYVFTPPRKREKQQNQSSQCHDSHTYIYKRQPRVKYKFKYRNTCCISLIFIKAYLINLPSHHIRRLVYLYPFIGHSILTRINIHFRDNTVRGQFTCFQTLQLDSKRELTQMSWAVNAFPFLFANPNNHRQALPGDAAQRSTHQYDKQPEMTTKKEKLPFMQQSTNLTQRDPT